MELIVLAAILCACGALYYWGRCARNPEVRALRDHLTGARNELEEARAVLQQQEAAFKEAQLAKDHNYAAMRQELDQVRVVQQQQKEAQTVKNPMSAIKDQVYATRGHELLQVRATLQKLEAALKEAQAAKDQMYALGQVQIENIRKDGALLPSLVRWADQLQEEYDRQRSLYAERHYASAPVAADRVREANARARLAERERNELRNRVALYEAQAPWLSDYTDLTVEEILTGFRLDEDISNAIDQGEDPVQIFLSPGEWASLDTVARNQCALDRYLERTRARSAWAAGIEYERYVGFCYEREGWEVEYHGATRGREDLGIDLICTRNDQALIVQCKRLSVDKGIPVRENVLGQLFGAARFFAYERKCPPESVTPVLVTSFELSPTARRFASALGVTVREREPLKDYPRIKCNISRSTGERIYHLPFDQQYDYTVVERDHGEKYVFSVAEAEANGFRRAFRWRGK